MDKMRWRYGDTNPVVAAVDAGTGIEIGDLVYLDVDDAKPVDDFLSSQEITVSRMRELKEKFLGVAMQRSRSGDTDPIRVATTGVFEFDCAYSTYELGDLVAPVGNQKVSRGKRKLAIARVARRAPLSTDMVLVDIRSTVMTGGV